MGKEAKREHKKLFGYNKPRSEVEVITIRLRAVAQKIDLEIPLLRTKKKAVKFKKEKTIFNGKSIVLKTFNRSEFYSGYKFKGPAIVLEDTSTIFITPGFKCLVDGWGNIVAKR